MKFMTFKWKDAEKYGVANDEKSSVWDIESLSRDSNIPCPQSLIDGIAEDSMFLSKISKLIEWGKENNSENYLIPFAEISWLAPIPSLRKNIMCVGKNYRDHAIEMGSEADIPEHVMVFTKAPTSVIGHNEYVDAHQEITSELDYEGELALVIGKKGKNISQQHALDHVFGYTILNDITARDLQQRHKQFFIGKSLDASCPIGPWIVSKEDIGNPNYLQITTKVNGEIRQNSNTEHFIFPIEEVISVLSQGMTLEPGDIIATGTPAGVGKGFKPPRFLKPGDEVEIEVEGIGILNNIVK
ncbi:fumarylacetoacetate hydrolase family protein [Lederbergia citrea]|uniref:Fumarylacetoacetate hydrolase family protein n=1 Tax=Lederbergia citrea TaxID=2833581 RepID=A0A942Z423_9BACI|nr:fumarylacetoacetate hydrolase family protein [Lederbergia citrea]MBS4177426.1 fumarylacetoacetate hydrolase family protein [Lederbergia citrea]MBS4204104.1 fumarylacetoacetate hydrolase family protein [Lederbergia citrea]MBS4221311.1 fumarylacetoacetate hydrolase family protein [Lederbergia citrea]